MSIDPVSLAIMVALNAATMAITASRSIEGPRLSDLSVTVADYGTPLPNFVGQRRIEAPVIYAEPIKETRRTRKGKGGKYREYSYSGTFAVIVADHEIEAYVRVWLDRRLAYDVTGAGPIEDSLNARTYMRFYFGTETQDPDERMLATVESEEGVGTCPAYLGVAYIFFEELPLEPFGNRFPMCSVEARRTALPAFPFTDLVGQAAGGSLRNGTFSPDGKKFLIASNLPSANVSIFDLENLTVLGARDLTTPATQLSNVAWFSDDTIQYVAENRRDVVTIDLFGNEIAKSVDAFPTVLDEQEGFIVIADGNGRERRFTTAYSFLWRYAIDGDIFDTGVQFGAEFRVLGWVRDQFGDIWGSGNGRLGGIDTTYIFRAINVSGRPVPGGNFKALFTNTPASPLPRGGLMYCSSARHFVIRYEDVLYAIDDETLDVKFFEDLDVGGDNSGVRIQNLTGPAEFLWSSDGQNAIEISLSTLQVVRTIFFGSWVPSLGAHNGMIYSPYLSAGLIFGWSGGSSPGLFFNIMRICYFDRTVTDTVTLGDVATLISDAVNLPIGDREFSALDQIISGFSWTQGAAKQILDPLFALYDSLLVPDGFALRGVKRGGAVVGDPISFENFARTSDTEPTEPYKVDVISESDLPRRLFLTFADLNAEQQPNTATAQRAAQSVLTVRELSYDMTTLALTAEEAQQLTERAMRRPWIGSLQGENKFPPNYLWVLPGDILDLKLDDETTIRTCIKRKVISPNRTVTVRWEQDRAAVAQLADTPGAEAVGRPPASVFSPRQTLLFVLDTPLVSDADDQTVPFLYLAATPATQGDWPGADAQTSLTGNVNTFEPGFFQFAASQAATAGYCTTLVPDAISTVPDLATQIGVRFYGDVPNVASATMEDLIANPTLNLAAVGKPDRFELIQFMNADLVSDGEWLFSGLLRGRRGTERLAALHEPVDYFILYDSTWSKRDMGASRLSETIFYQAITYGLLNSSQGAQVDTFNGEANRPLSVANVQIVKDYGTGSFHATWQRRTRLGGSNIDGQDVPLGETSELYNIRVMNGTTVVRSEQVTSPSFEYTAYEQIEDLGTEQSTTTLQIEQVSPVLNLAGPTVQATG